MVLLLAGCRQEESVYVAEEDESITVNYEVEIGDGTDSRGIGDGSRVDQLVVGIFRDGSLVTTLTFADDADGTKDGKFQNIAIPMMRTETYDLAFWAQKNGNGIYDINEENFLVNINLTSPVTYQIHIHTAAIISKCKSDYIIFAQLKIPQWLHSHLI